MVYAAHIRGVLDDYCRCVKVAWSIRAKTPYMYTVVYMEEP